MLTEFAFTQSYDEATATMDTGYPRSVDDDFPGMDDEFDAVTYQYGTNDASEFTLSADTHHQH